MKIPGPMIAVLLIIVLLFCCTSGLGLQGSLNVITFDSAQDLMSGDLFSFLRPRVGVSDVLAPPACLVITGTGDDRQLSEITLPSGGGSCAFSVVPSDAEVRTLPLRFVSGQARVDYVPASDDDESAIEIDDRIVNAGNAELNVSVSKSGGTVTVQCQNACRLGIGD